MDTLKIGLAIHKIGLSLSDVSYNKIQPYLLEINEEVIKAQNELVMMQADINERDEIIAELEEKILLKDKLLKEKIKQER